METKPAGDGIKKAENEVQYDLTFKGTFLVLSCPYTEKTWEIWKTTNLKGKRVLVRTDQQEAWVKKTNGVPVKENKIDETVASRIIAIDKKSTPDIDADLPSEKLEKYM